MGGEPSVQKLLLDHREEVLSYIQRILPAGMRSNLEPEDVWQEVAYKAFLHAGTLPRGVVLVRWLKTVARNHVIDSADKHEIKKRQESRKKRFDDSGAIPLIERAAVYDRTPSASAAAHEVAELVQQIVGGLGGQHEQVLRLRYFQGLSAKVTAERMNRTPGAIDQLCHQALGKFRLRLSERLRGGV